MQWLQWDSCVRNKKKSKILTKNRFCRRIVSLSLMWKRDGRAWWNGDLISRFWIDLILIGENSCECRIQRKNQSTSIRCHRRFKLKTARRIFSIILIRFMCDWGEKCDVVEFEFRVSFKVFFFFFVFHCFFLVVYCYYLLPTTLLSHTVIRSLHLSRLVRIFPKYFVWHIFSHKFLRTPFARSLRLAWIHSFGFFLFVVVVLK